LGSKWGEGEVAKLTLKVKPERDEPRFEQKHFGIVARKAKCGRLVFTRCSRVRRDEGGAPPGGGGGSFQSCGRVEDAAGTGVNLSAQSMLHGKTKHTNKQTLSDSENPKGVPPENDKKKPILGCEPWHQQNDPTRKKIEEKHRIHTQPRSPPRKNEKDHKQPSSEKDDEGVRQKKKASLRKQRTTGWK